MSHLTEAYEAICDLTRAFAGLATGSPGVGAEIKDAMDKHDAVIDRVIAWKARERGSLNAGSEKGKDNG